jgi:hypothetical protein
LGKAFSAGATVEQAILAVLVEMTGDGEICGAAASEVGALGILTAESRKVVHGVMCSIEVKGRDGLGILL